MGAVRGTDVRAEAVKLFSVALHCVKVTWRGGVPKIAQGVSVGPLVAEDAAAVQRWAEAAVTRQFPAFKGWEQHAYTFAEVIDEQIDAVRPAPVVAEPVKVKQRKKTAREEWDGDE